MYQQILKVTVPLSLLFTPSIKSHFTHVYLSLYQKLYYANLGKARTAFEKRSRNHSNVLGILITTKTIK